MVHHAITTETAKERLNIEKGIVLFDVRTVEENMEKRIPGSLLIPVGEIKKQATEKLKDKDAVTVGHCRFLK